MGDILLGVCVHFCATARCFKVCALRLAQSISQRKNGNHISRKWDHTGQKFSDEAKVYMTGWSTDAEVMAGKVSVWYLPRVITLSLLSISLILECFQNKKSEFCRKAVNHFSFVTPSNKISMLCVCYMQCRSDNEATLNLELKKE